MSRQKGKNLQKEDLKNSESRIVDHEMSLQDNEYFLIEQEIRKLFHLLQNTKIAKRRKEIKKIMEFKVFDFLNDKNFEDELDEAKKKYEKDKKKNKNYLNEFFEEKHHILFQKFDENFSTKKMKKIIIGCALFVKMRKLLKFDKKENDLKEPNIFSEQYFPKSNKLEASFNFAQDGELKRQSANPEPPNKDFIDKVRDQNFKYLEKLTCIMESKENGKILSELKKIFENIFNLITMKNQNFALKQNNLDIVQKYLKDIPQLYEKCSDQLKLIVLECIYEMKIEAYLPLNSFRLYYPSEKVLQILLNNENNELKQWLKNEYLLESDLFKNEYKFFSELNIDENIEEVNKRLKQKFQILFKENLQNIGQEQKINLLIGLAIFQKVNQKIQRKEKLKIPNVLSIKSKIDQLGMPNFQSQITVSAAVNQHFQRNFNENPIQLIQSLINERKEIPFDFDQRIQNMFEDQYLKRVKNEDISKFSKMIFSNLSLFQNENNQDFKKMYKSTVEKCFKYLAQSQNSEEILKFFHVYLKLKLPELQLERALPIGELIKKDFYELNKILPLIEDVYSIQDFMIISSTYQIECFIRELESEFASINIIAGKKLIVLLFEYIKRKQDFQEVIKIFSKVQKDVKLSQIGLFTYLYLHTDVQMRNILFSSCSQFMAIPITALNPWDLDEMSQMPRRIIFTEAIYAYEKNKSIFQFKYPQGQNIQGCSRLLNNIFGKRFQEHSESALNQGSIEIQFDHNCKQRKYLAVADAHGSIEDELISNISILFDCLIIHTDQDYNSHSQLKKLVENIKKKVQNRLIIVYHQNDNIQLNQIAYKQLEANLSQFFIRNLQSIDDQVKNKFFEILHDYYQLDSINYQGNPILRLQNKRRYLDFIGSYQELKNQHQQINIQFQTAENILKELIKIEDFRSQRFLPMLNFSKSNIEYQNILKNNEDLTDKDVQNLLKNIEQNSKLMFNQESLQFIQKFQEVINYNIQLEIFPILAQYIEGFLENKKKTLDTEKERLDDLFNSSKTIEAKNKYRKQIEEQQKLIDAKTFSLELILREIYYFSQFNKESRKYKSLMMKHTSQQIQTCQPLELIDGDTLQYIKNLYEEIYSVNDKEDVLVVSVVGVQSAGKSFLLNFLFGTQFVSSSGRCTKGVYACILNYKCSKTNKSKKIMVLDTEGIQSSGARNEQFDRKIVYYIFSISHVVLLCKQSEMDRKMAEIIQLCASLFVNSKQQNILAPTIFIILNISTGDKEKVKRECITSLQKYLSEINGNDQDINNDQADLANQILKIGSENVIPLDQAYNEKSFGPNKKILVKYLKSDFSDMIAELRHKILQKFNEIEKGKSTKIQLYQWFKFSQHIWQYTNQLRDLECFTNLKQKSDDKKMIGIINMLVQNYYENKWAQEYKNFIDNHLDSTLKQFQVAELITFAELHDKIKFRVDQKYDEIQLEVKEQFQNQCQMEGIQNESYDNRQITLKKKNKFYRAKVDIYCAQKVQEFVQQKTKNIGDRLMQQQTIEFMKQKRNYTQEESEKKFEDVAWPLVKSKCKNVLSSPKEVFTNINNLVEIEFEQSIKISNLRNSEICYQKYEEFNNLKQVFDYITKNLDQKLLVFTGQYMSPDFYKLKAYQDQNREQFYLKLPKTIFIQETKYKYYNWKEAMDKIVNTKSIAIDICKALFQKQNNEVIQYYEQKDQFLLNGNIIEIQTPFYRNQHNLQNVNIIFLKFKNQIEKLGIKVEENLKFSDFIPSQQTEKNKKLLRKNQTQIVNEEILFLLSKKNFFRPFKAPESFEQSDFQALQNNFSYLNLNKFKETDYIITSQIDTFKNEYFSLSNKSVPQISIQMMAQTKNLDSLKNYFQFLFDKNYDKIDFQVLKHLKEMFWNNLKWEHIFKQIEKCILRNFQINYKDIQSKNLADFIQILRKQDQESYEVRKNFYLFQPKRIQEVIKDIRQIISDINKELDNFCLTISDEGTSLIYMHAQIAVNSLVFFLQLVENNEPLRMLDERKEIEKELFICRLTMNSDKIDKAQGKKMSSQFLKYCFDKAKKLAIETFKQEMQKIDKEFKNFQYVNMLEDECIRISQNNKIIIQARDQKNIDNLIDYKIDPTNFLKNFFDLKYNEHSQRIIQKCNQNFIDNFNNPILELIQYLGKFNSQIECSAIKGQKASTIFQVEKKPNETQINEIIKYQQNALMTYFKQIFEQNWDSDGFYIYMHNKIWLKKNSKLPSHWSIFQNQKNAANFVEYQSCIVSIFNEEDCINDISIFMQEALDRLKTDRIQMQKNLVLNEKDLHGECKLSLRNLLIGCTEHCPLCKKQCDELHGDHEHENDKIHQCDNGHQLQAFGGSKSYQDKTAVLQSCDDLVDNQVIKHNGLDFTWENFKKIFNNWNLEQKNQDKKELNRKRNVDMWNLIGKQLCLRYKNEKMIDIIFKEASLIPEITFKKIHYILMLDDSGSMKGQKWEGLKKAFSNFIAQLVNDRNQRLNSWITVINHNESTERFVKEEEPQLNLVDKIEFRGGENNFDLPLIEAHQFCNESKYDQIILYFMSDGEWHYPQKGIQLILNAQFLKKIQFYTVAYGSEANKIILKKMADQFPDGKLIDAPNAKALAQSFMDIVPNIYN